MTFQLIPQYSINNGDVVVVDSSTGASLWAGRPDDKRAEAIAQVLGCPDVFVLLDYMECEGEPTCRNIVRLAPTGEIKWYAAPPSSDQKDAYVALEEENDSIRAQTWSGYEVILNIEDGRIRRRTFSK